MNDSISAEAYKRLFNHYSNGIVFFRDWKIFYKNNAIDKVLNSSGRVFKYSYGGELIDEILSFVKKIYDNLIKDYYIEDIINIRIQNHDICLNLKVNLMSNGDDTNIDILVVIEDCTPLLKVESQYNKLMTTLEQSPTSIIITDLDGNIEYVNPKFCHLTGYSKMEVLGKNPRILKSGYQSDELYKEMWETIISGKTWRGEFQNKKKNGDIYWEYVTVFPIKDSDGFITNYAAVKEDINIQKKMSMELSERNEELVVTLDELKMAQTKLIQQEQIAGIGQLAAGVAHEINNPLGFVISNIKTLDEYVKSYRSLMFDFRELFESNDNVNLENIKDEVRKLEDKYDLEFINEDVEGLIFDSTDGLERIEKIVKSLRSFSRIDQLDRFENYNINEGILSTLTVARNEVKYDAEIILELEEDIPYIMGIGSQINQVLLNMIINGVQAIRMKRADVGGELGSIDIKTYSDLENIFIEIRDSGIGISNENLDKIFQPFFTTKPVGKGTGLGLGIAYDIIVHKHGGEIDVESSVGVGTNFKIRLPIYQETQSDEEE